MTFFPYPTTLTGEQAHALYHFMRALSDNLYQTYCHDIKRYEAQQHGTPVTTNSDNPDGEPFDDDIAF